MNRLKRIIGLIMLIKYKILYHSKILINWSVICSPNMKIRCNDNGRVIFNNRVHLRDNVLLNVSQSGEIILEDNVFINDDCKLNCKKRIYIGEGTLIGQNVLFYDHDHDYKKGIIDKRSNYVLQEIVIGKNVWIGSGCIILKGVHIGDNAVIGAGTIVTHDVEANNVIYSKQTVEKKEILYE